jgi:mannan endo-1,4-beta-mannosidase
MDEVDRILTPAQPGLLGSYYRGIKFADAPALTRVDKEINFEWRKGPSKDIGHDNFCVRWEGLIKITKPGHYTFATITDDGARLWINGKQLIDEWKIQGATRHHGEIDLTEGQYEIKLEYYQAFGEASCRLHWALQGGFKEEIIPPAALLHVPKK